MKWLLWRLYRKQIFWTSVSLAAYVIVECVVGLAAAHAYHQALAAGTGDYNDTIETVNCYLPLAGIVMPLIVGMFWGAPLLAKEYEENTNKFIWMQGVTRRKWLAVSLGNLLVIVILYGIALSLSAMWALHLLPTSRLGGFQWTHFDVQGLMPAVYAVFAVALGAAIGAWHRRVLPALAITLAVFVILQLTMGIFVRPHFVKPLLSQTITYQHATKDTKHGYAFTVDKTVNVGPQLSGSAPDWLLGFSFSNNDSCGSPAVHNGQVCTAQLTQSIKFQPANRFWRFQFMEAGMYLVVTVMLIAVTFRLVKKRDV